MLYGIYITFGVVVMVGKGKRCDVLHETSYILFHLPRVADAGKQQYMSVVLAQHIRFHSAFAPKLIHGPVVEGTEEKLLIGPDV